jgi:hypothetical protein
MVTQAAIVKARGLQKLLPPGNQKKEDQSPGCSKRLTMHPSTTEAILPIVFNGIWMK